MRHFPRTRKYWPFKRIGRSNCTGAPYDGAESACYRYNHHIGYLDGTTRYGNWYDPFIAALSAGGGTDSMALSQGISEALINTAFGILTGALAVISYNYYTNKIDKLTYSLDEVGFSIVQTFAASHK